jgi:hypothetical protein
MDSCAIGQPKRPGKEAGAIFAHDDESKNSPKIGDLGLRNASSKWPGPKKRMLHRQFRYIA